MAVGAHEGFFYIRHEYPLAVKRMRAAIKICQKRGWLGERLLGADYPFKVTHQRRRRRFCLRRGNRVDRLDPGRARHAESAAALSRRRKGFGASRPSSTTLRRSPWCRGSCGTARRPSPLHGTGASKGTKVFALAGNVQRGGLIEIPMGTTIREIVEHIGGGVRPGRRFKAVQIGGPSGGCVPARLADTPVDFESLREVGAIMGSGGLVVLDDSACMVDIARYFLQFTQDQSCGKCTFCRVGTRRMLDLLDRLCAGKGHRDDLAELERLARQVSAGSLCGLGKTAPNPGADHPALFPRGIRSPPAGPLSRRQMHGPHQIPASRTTAPAAPFAPSIARWMRFPLHPTSAT